MKIKFISSAAKIVCYLNVVCNIQCNIQFDYLPKTILSINTCIAGEIYIFYIYSNNRHTLGSWLALNRIKELSGIVPDGKKIRNFCLLASLMNKLTLIKIDSILILSIGWTEVRIFSGAKRLNCHNVASIMNDINV